MACPAATERAVFIHARVYELLYVFRVKIPARSRMSLVWGIMPLGGSGTAALTVT